MDFTKDVTIGVDQLSRLSDIVRKVRSTARFLLGNVYRDGNVKSSKDGLPRDDFGLVSEYVVIENSSRIRLTFVYLNRSKDTCYTFSTSSSTQSNVLTTNLISSKVRT